MYEQEIVSENGYGSILRAQAPQYFEFHRLKASTEPGDIQKWQSTNLQVYLKGMKDAFIALFIEEWPHVGWQGTYDSVFFRLYASCSSFWLVLAILIKLEVLFGLRIWSYFCIMSWGSWNLSMDGRFPDKMDGANILWSLF